MKKIHTLLLLFASIFLVACQDTTDKDIPFDYSAASVSILNDGTIYLDELDDYKFQLDIVVQNALDEELVFVLDQLDSFVLLSEDGEITIAHNTPKNYWFNVTAILKAASSKFYSKDFIVNLTRGVIVGTEQISQVALTINGDPMTSRGISWFTSSDIEDSVVYVADNPDFNDAMRFYGEINAFEATNEAADFANKIPAKTHYNHQALVTGLLPDTQYYYKVGSDIIDKFSHVGTFKTANESGEFKMFLTTDVHVGANERAGASTRFYHAALTDAFNRYDDIDYALNTGDMVTQWYSGYHYFESEWAYAMNISPLLRQLTFIPVAGNHDAKVTSPDFYYSLANHYSLPPSPSLIDDDHMYGPNYAFEINDLHVTILNYHERDFISEDQKLWLEDELSKTDKTWKIVFSHILLPTDVQEILERHQVVLAYSGHEHVYRRTAPLLNGEVQDTTYNKDNGFAINPNGTTYVVNTTTGGAGEWRPYNPQPYEIDGFGIHSQINDLGSAQTRWGMYSVLTINDQSIKVDVYVRNSTDATHPFSHYTTYGFELVS